MVLNLQQIRDFVRGHMDIEEEDLPDPVLDVFVAEGFGRIVRAEKRWPFYATRWAYVTVAGTDEIPFTDIGTNISEIQSIKGPSSRLHYIGMDVADEVWPENVVQSSEPSHWSVENETLYLWPTPGSAYSLILRGYRKPTDWMAGGAGAVPDVPDELHNTVAVWALSRAYEQQDDPEMASIFERKFADELNLFRRRIHDTPAAQPLVVSGRHLHGGALPMMRFDGSSGVVW